MATDAQFWQSMKARVYKWFKKWLLEEDVYNSQAWLDGDVVFVRADGKFANVQFPGTDTPTTDIPVTVGLTLAVGDKVRVQRIHSQDYFVVFKKPV